jgi:anthranilate synthase/aminodeoxychorismate synthase-like glutamine amidotransferase
VNTAPKLGEKVPAMNIFLVDNYDSFTYNLYDLIFRSSGIRAQVIKNDELTFEEFAAHSVDCVILSPGPGHPRRRKDFGISSDIIAELNKPTLGICLGHQGIATVFGGRVQRALLPVHGLTERINHDGSGIFAGIPQKVQMVRYHSLIVSNDLPENLRKTAWTDSGLVMGIQHVSRKIFGVQFHPESICSEFGELLMSNFLRIANNDI